MKKRYLFFTLSLPFFALKIGAQPILTNSNTSFQAGDVFTAVAIEYLPEGEAGANATWNFSLVDELDATTFSVLAASESPNAINFPEADVFLVQEGDECEEFYNTIDLAYERLGFSTSSYNLFYSNAQTVFNYPFTYNSSLSDTYESFYTQSGLDKERLGSSTTAADAYGSITLPNGTTYSDVLRIKTTETFTDGYVGQAPTLESSSTIYNWYLPGYHYPIFGSYSYVFNGFDIQASIYSYPTNVGIEENTIAKSFNLFPNPSTITTNLNYDLIKAGGVTISVINSIGQTVENRNFLNQSAGKHKYILETEKYSKGLYLVNLQVGGKMITKQLVVE
jgi:Secretion system C-terminal sorting domain